MNVRRFPAGLFTIFAAGVIGLGSFLCSAQLLAQTTDQGPSRVVGLGVTVYSGTAAGLKWQGATGDRGVRGYKVFRENELVGEVDARSYIVKDLTPGETNFFAVMPVYLNGQGSGGTVGIQFSTPGGARDVVAPETPALRVAVYSPTAAGLAWTRPTDPGIASNRVAQYEVRRDGVLVDTTRAVSYIDSSLAAGTTYEYQVVAINSQGGRAAPARISVSTPGVSVGGSGGPGGDPAVAAPTGLRSSAYSSTAAGIAWARPSTPGLRYAVARDGTSLGTTDGTSFVDQSLSADRTYRYDIVAIDRQGRRSAASSVTVTTPTADGGPSGPVTPPPVAVIPGLDQGAENILGSLAGYQLEAAIVDIRSFAARVSASALATRELPAPDTGDNASPSARVTATSSATEYDCILGGQMVVESIDVAIRESSGDRERKVDNFRFDQCRLGGDDAPDTLVGGTFTAVDLFESESIFDSRNTIYLWSDFSSVGPDSERLAIDGSVAIDKVDNDRAADARRVALNRYERTFQTGQIERLEDAVLTLRTLTDGAYEEYTLSASGTVTSPATGGTSVVVETPVALFRRYGSAYDSNNTGLPFAGSLSFRSNAGQSLDIDVLDTWTEGFRVDRRYTGADGESSERTDVPFADLTVELPEASKKQATGAVR